MQLSPEEQKKQEYYRDARFTKQYDGIWKSVGKCVFCDLREKYIFFEENGVVMTVSLFAYIDGHFMIMPRRHIRSPKELTQIEWDTIRKFFYMAKKLIRDVPGGHVTDFSGSLETELAREVREETGLDIAAQKLVLLDSRLDKIAFTRHEEHLKTSYDIPHSFLWNTYLVADRLPKGTKATPGDDCQAIVWMDLQQATTYERLSDGVRDVLKKALEHLES
jgi:ADP-ribose pyrophosphatase YjhB (NUDIX family)